MSEALILADLDQLVERGEAEYVTPDIAEALIYNYLALDWPIFPIKARDKTPLTRNGVKDATTDWAQVNEWMAQFPNCNWGLSAEAAGLLIVDLDGPEGKLSWAQLVKEHGHRPTLTCATGGGGFHFYYDACGDRTLPNSASRLGPKVDTRGRGGYVLVPPSVHPNGTPYTWFTHPRDGDTWRYVDRGRPAPVPGWIREALRAPAPAPRPPAPARRDAGQWAGRLDGLRLAVASAPEGQRNSVYNWAVYTGAKDAGIPLDVLEILKDEALAAGLSPREVEATWGSAVAKAGVA